MLKPSASNLDICQILQKPPAWLKSKKKLIIKPQAVEIKEEQSEEDKALNKSRYSLMRILPFSLLLYIDCKIMDKNYNWYNFLISNSLGELS